jgi:hypothetical protein
MRNEYIILDGKPEGKRPFTKPRSRWEDNITTDLRMYARKVWIGCIWLRTRISGGLL